MPRSARRRPTSPDRLSADARAVLAAVPEPALVLDADGSVLDVNAPLVDLTGRARSELIGAAAPQTWWSLRGWRSGDITAGDVAVTVTDRVGREVPHLCALRELPGGGVAGPRWTAVLMSRNGGDRRPDPLVRLVNQQEAMLRVARATASSAPRRGSSGATPTTARSSSGPTASTGRSSG